MAEDIPMNVDATATNLVPAAADAVEEQPPVPLAKMMLFMWRYALCMDACIEWSVGYCYIDADCFNSEPKSRTKALVLCLTRRLGVAAVGVRATGWQSPSPYHPDTDACMRKFAEHRTKFAKYYKDEESLQSYFDYYEASLSEWYYKLPYWLTMRLLPYPVINFCDERGQASALSEFNSQNTASFLVRSQLFTCATAISLLDVTVVPPDITGACLYFTQKPILLVSSFSVGVGRRINAMLGFLPESKLSYVRDDALMVLAEIWARSDLLSPPQTSVWAAFTTIRDLCGFNKNPIDHIGLRSSASQGICAIHSALAMGGGRIYASFTEEGSCSVRIEAADSDVICKLWNEPGARDKAEAKAIDDFIKNYLEENNLPSWAASYRRKQTLPPPPPPPSDPALASLTEAELFKAKARCGVDAPEISPKLLERIFKELIVYSAVDEEDREKALMKVGRCIDDMTSTNADFARQLHKTLVLVRTPSPDRPGGHDLSQLLNEENGTLPPWSSKSAGFEGRLAEARERAGSKTTYRPFDCNELRDDDGEKIKIPEGKTEFQVLRELLPLDERIGRKRAGLAPQQKGKTFDDLWRRGLRREDRTRQSSARAREATEQVSVGRELNEAELAALRDEWAREQAAADP